jgi:hypothetical protein
MGTPLIGMTIKEACEVVQEYANLHTGGDILEGLKDMQACWDDLDKEDRVAHRMFIQAGQKLFAQPT